MASTQLHSREHLEMMRSSAFESEHAWLYDASYQQHKAAALALEHQIEQSLASVSPDENLDEQLRIIKTQISIHRERQRALRPHLESGSDQIDEYGNECIFVPAPNQWGANGDLDEESESLSAVCATLHLCATHRLIFSGTKPPDMASLVLTHLLHAPLRRASLARHPLPLSARPKPAHHHIPPPPHTRMDRFFRTAQVHLHSARVLGQVRSLHARDVTPRRHAGKRRRLLPSCRVPKPLHLNPVLRNRQEAHHNRLLQGRRLQVTVYPLARTILTASQRIPRPAT